MTTAASKRSIMTLFSSKTDVYSHQVKIVLAEKGVAYDLELVDPNNISEELVELNPYNSVPTLVDRELVLFNSRIIMEYLDERFPHPPLMPVYPVLRGKVRLYMLRIEQDWYSVLRLAENGNEEEKQSALNQLKEEILALSPLFSQNPYFMNDEFGLVDCYIAALLWRLKTLGLEFTGAGSKAIKDYMDRIFNRQSFIQSLGVNTPKYFIDEK